MEKVETPSIATRMMDRGEFTLWHAWEGAAGRVEYWRGNSRNGACVRRLDDAGGMTRATHIIGEVLAVASIFAIPFAVAFFAYGFGY